MGLGPSRIALSIGCGVLTTSLFYVSGRANGHALALVHHPAARTVSGNVAVASLPRRLVIHHSQPGDVILTLHGSDVSVEFRPDPLQAPKRGGTPS